MELSDLRHDFVKLKLDIGNLASNPIKLLEAWLNDASNQHIPEFNAMVLSTADSTGKPSSRIVLLKEITDIGSLLFYSNYESRKGNDIEGNPYVSLNFFWREFERQVRIEGEALKVSRAVSEKYFNSRPVDSRISAIVSPQSQVINSLEILKEQAETIKKEEVKLPEYWGGYSIKPLYFEFWQGGKNRLHDRISYSLNKDSWQRKRLAP